MRYLVIALMFSGCTTPMSPPHFYKAATSPEAQERDEYECERDARMVRRHDCVEMRMFISCMVAKGYTERLGTGSMWRC